MKTRLLLLLSALLLLAGCADNNKKQMLAQLAELERQNVADSLMTNDTLALQLTEYFDRHGTPNERLRAYYILGRTYTDLGDAPRALSSYLDAIMSADTAATDCDYAKLSRVYGWMSDILYKQKLMEDCIENLDRSVYYAWKAGDTVQALTEKVRKPMAYIHLNKPDSVIIEFYEVFNEMKHYLGINLASKYSLIPVKTLLDRHELEKAKSLLDIYEHHSGFVDSTGNVVKGREQYYYYKGYYYLCNEQLDSAEYYFRKELQNNNGFLEQNAGAYGLADLFRLQHRYDSAMKYALYSYDMNDSVYTHKATDEVERATAMFNYTRYQQKAFHEQERAEQERVTKQWLYFILVVLCLLAVGGVLWWRKKNHENAEKYRAKVSELDRLQADLKKYRENEALLRNIMQGTEQKEADAEALQTYINELHQQIGEKEAQISNLTTQLSHVHRSEKILNEDILYKLSRSPLFETLKHHAEIGSRLTDDDLSKTEHLAETTMPCFFQFISQRKHLLSNTEYYTCLLLRMGFRVKEIALMLGVSSPNISQISGEIMKRLFNGVGSSKKLKKKLDEMGENE